MADKLTLEEATGMVWYLAEKLSQITPYETEGWVESAHQNYEESQAQREAQRDEEPVEVTPEAPTVEEVEPDAETNTEG